MGGNLDSLLLPLGIYGERDNSEISGEPMDSACIVGTSLIKHMQQATLKDLRPKLMP
jgi:hypothetical protein